MASRCTRPSPGADLLLRPLRPAAPARAPLPDEQVRAPAGACPRRRSRRRRARRAGRTRRGHRSRALSRLPGPGRGRHAVRGRAARDRLPVDAADGRALAADERRHRGGRARRARRRRRGEPRRRHAPRFPRPRRGLLHPERQRDRGAYAAGRRPGRARRGDRLRRAPGQRHRVDLPRRPDGVHVLDPRREQLPVRERGGRPRRGARRRHRRSGVPRGPRARRRGDAGAGAAGARDLPRRRRSRTTTTASGGWR